nr:MAG TPA: hypothetical protein [Caudoviricetes sp.]
MWNSFCSIKENNCSVLLCLVKENQKGKIAI